MPQTSVPAVMVIGSAGQLADLHTVSDGDVVSGTNTEASASIPFGVMCTRDTANDGGIKLAASLANVQNAAGILVNENIFDVTTQLDDVTVNTNAQSAIKVGVTGSVMRRGRIIVIPESSGAETAAVRVRTSGAGQIGCFTGGAAVVGQTINLGPAAKWIGAPVAGQPSVVEINAINLSLATAD